VLNPVCVSIADPAETHNMRVYRLPLFFAIVKTIGMLGQRKGQPTLLPAATAAVTLDSVSQRDWSLSRYSLRGFMIDPASSLRLVSFFSAANSSSAEFACAVFLCGTLAGITFIRARVLAIFHLVCTSSRWELTTRRCCATPWQSRGATMFAMN
jgi:hypothetical protein